MSVDPFTLATGFVVIIAVVGWLNVRLFRIPPAVAMTLAGVVGAGLLVLLRNLGPPAGAAARLSGALGAINFPRALLGYLLAFLLFAGAMQVDLQELRRHRLSVWSLATLGVLASTLLVGGGLWLVAGLLGAPLSLAWACVFGALISPTDPIAVLAAVAGGGFSKRLQVLLQGEALFNDGVGIVVLSAVLAIAAGGAAVHPLAALGEVVLQAAGGLALGLVVGTLVVSALRAVDDYAVEVTITLALALALYAMGQALHVSGPIAVVAGGLLVGNTGVATAMSDQTRRYVEGFWTLIDEILNALLFLVLGLELAVVGAPLRFAPLWAAAIVLVILARVAVALGRLLPAPPRGTRCDPRFGVGRLARGLVSRAGAWPAVRACAGDRAVDHLRRGALFSGCAGAHLSSRGATSAAAGPRGGGPSLAR